MKILQLITRDHNRSGSGVQMMQLSLELARQGHDVTAVYKYNSDRDDDFIPYDNSTVNLQRIGLTRCELKLSSFVDLLKIRLFIKSGQYDVIHSHSNAADHAYLATLGMDIPIFANRGMCAPLKWGNALKYKSKKIVRSIAVAEDVKDVMHTTGSVPNDKISVIYGSVDVSRFHPNIQTEVTKEQLGIDKNAFVIGYTGSIGGRKGINYLIDAFRQVARQKENVVLLLVGISDEQLTAHKILMQAELKSKIVCVGFQHKPENFMMLYDLFVFPGTRSEGLTGAIREAAAMKIPVVTTDIGGNKELIKHGERGIVVEPKSAVALEEGILALLDEYDNATQMAARAYAFIHEHMTLSIRTHKVLSLYQECLHQQHS